MINSLLEKKPVSAPVLDKRIITPTHPEWSAWAFRLKHAPVFAIDTETYGDALNPFKNKIRLLQVGVTAEAVSNKVPKNAACLMIDFHNPDHVAAWDEFRPVLRDCVENETQGVMGQNLNFDLMTYRCKWGWRAKSTIDTMIMSNVLWAGIREYRHGLGAIAERCKIKLDKTQQRSDWGAKKLSTEQLNYAALDVLALFPIASKLWKMLDKSGAIEAAHIENEFVAALVDMEYNGMPVNEPMLSDLEKSYSAIATQLLDPVLKVWEEMGDVEMAIPGLLIGREPFQPTQATHLIEIIEHLTGDKLTETNKETLAPYQHIDAVRNIQLWRTLKTQQDYVTNVRLGLRESEYGSVCSGGFRQFSGLFSNDGGAGSGRTASGQTKPFHCPNLQNASDAGRYPKELKKLGMKSPRDTFKAPKGRKLLISDLSAAHARIATDLSEDAGLIAGYMENVDNHVIVAKSLADFKALDWSAMPSKPIKDEFDYKVLPEGKALRSTAKNAFYGFLNAGGAATLQRTCAKVGIEISLDMAKATTDGLKKTYKGLYKYMRDTHRSYCKAAKYKTFGTSTYAVIQPDVGGRLCYSKCWPNDFRDGKLEPKMADCLSKTWLGIEANAIKSAATAAYYASIDNPEWELRMGAIVHDEIDGSVSEEYAEEAAAMLLSVTDNGLQRYLKHIPANDNSDPSALIADCWSEK